LGRIVGRQKNANKGTGSRATRAFEISGELDRLEAEVVKLEVQRLARRFGVEISKFAVKRKYDDEMSR